MNVGQAFSFIIHKLFGTWEKIFATFSIVVGIASPLISFYILQYPEAIPDFVIMRDTGLLSLLIAMVLILAYGNARKDILHENKLIELNKEIENQKNLQTNLRFTLASQLAHANDMTQRSTQELFHHYRKIFLERADIESTADEFGIFREMCLSVTTHVREALIMHFRTLDIETEDDISVSVKLIMPLRSIRGLYPRQFARAPREAHQKDLRIITVFRDNKTWEANKISGEREVISSLYSIEGNTAFDDIVNGRKDRFAENNLRELQSRGHYSNENPKWDLQYNSTLVVPMVLQETVRVSKDECRYLGFLAVDSLNPMGKKLYDNEECYHILNHAAITLSNYFLVLILYHDR